MKVDTRETEGKTARPLWGDAETERCVRRLRGKTVLAILDLRTVLGELPLELV